MLAPLLAFGSSVVWGVSDFLGGIASRRHPVVAVLLVAELIGLSLALAAIGVTSTAPPPFERMVAAMLAGLAGGLGLVAFYRSMAIGTLSIVVPISAVGAVVPVAFSLAIGEVPNSVQIGGIAVAVIGAALAAHERTPEGVAVVSKGVGLALLGALGFGSFYIGMDIASEGGNWLWATASVRFLFVPLLAVIVLVRGVKVMSIKPDFGKIAAIGVLDVSANALVAAATTIGYIGIVSVLGMLYPVTTVLLAMIVLKERISRVQFGGIALALVGVVLITAG